MKLNSVWLVVLYVRLLYNLFVCSVYKSSDI